MVRRSRRRPRRQNRGTQLIQIVGLTLVLVIILLFRDEIAGGAGVLFGDDGSSDVQLPEERQRSTEPPGATNR